MYVTDLQGNSEPLIDFQSDTVSIRKNLEGRYELDFTIVKTDRNLFSYNMINEFSVITLNQENFVVRMVKENPYSKSVTCVHEFYELVDYVVTGSLDGLTTIQQALAIAFPQESGWTYNLTGTFNPVILNDFGRRNTVSLLNTIREQFGCEYTFTSVDKTITISNRIGIDTDYQVRNGHNLVSIERSIDSTDVKTAITVNYNPVDNVYRNSVTYISPFSNNYPRLKYADPVNFDTTSRTVAETYGATLINDTPKISITLEFIQLKNQGYNGNEINVGNSFYLIDDRLSERDLVRVNEIQEFPLSDRSPIVTIANRVRFYTDIAIQQRRQQILLQAELDRLNQEAIRKGQDINGVELTDANGLQVDARSDRGVVITMNANQGLLIENNNIRKFYVDTNGNVTFDGRLNITRGDGINTLLEAYLDTNGGIMNIYDNSSNLNVTLGSERIGSGFSGGAVSVYSDYAQSSPLAELNATISQSGNTPGGRMLLRNANNRYEVDADAGLGTIYVKDNNFSRQSFITPSLGYINNEQIATQNWVINYINSINP